MRHLRVCRAAVLACSQAGECTLPSLQSAQALLPQNRRLLSNCGTYQCNAQHSQLPSALSPACNFHTGVPATAAGGSSGSSSPGSPRTARRESAAAPWLPYGADSYKELVRQAFDGVAEQSVAEEADGARGASGDPLADKMLQGMLQRAQLLRGQRVLDVACGTGDMLLAAARAVGPQGRVLGVDLSPRMVEQARRAVGLCPSHADAPPPGSSAPGPQANTAAASANTHAPVEVLVSDAEILELPRASLDLITCSASLPYMYDPEGAVRRWREWLGPGGRLLVNVFRSPYDPECGLFYSLAARHGLPLRNPLEGLGSVEGCRELLRRAGYTRVQVSEESYQVLVGASSAREYAEAMWASSADSPHHNLQHLLGTSAPGTTISSTSRDPAADRPGRSSVGGHTGSNRTAVASAVVASGAGLAAGGLGGTSRSQAPAGRRQGLQVEQGRIGGRARGQVGVGAGGGGQVGGKGERAQAGLVAVDPGAVEAFRREFLDAAERSVQKRLVKGVVKTSVGVIYASGCR